MFKKLRIYITAAAGSALLFSSCKIPAIKAIPDQQPLPASFGASTDSFSRPGAIASGSGAGATAANPGASSDSSNTAATQWRKLFTDPYLISLIDTALKNNQELMTTLQEIEISRNETRLRHAQLLPTASLVAGAGVEKVGRYTSQGAGDATTDIKPGKEMPDPLPDFMIGVMGNWEADVWNKLHTAKKAAVSRYLATVEGQNFVKSNLVAEVANSYFELVALDHQLAIVKKNIGIQQNALEIVKIQKDAARATELGVKKFEAEVFRTRSLEFGIHQEITETENRLNFLLARYPQPVVRDTTEFMTELPAVVKAGIPSQLLENRPDVRQAELELEAAKMDVKVARAEFYPSVGIRAGIGFQAFKPTYLLRTPESLLYSLAGELAQPLINRNAIKAEFSSANARQLQALYNYQKTLLNAYLEVSNNLSGIDNLDKDYSLKLQQVAALNKSIEVATDLFRYARADYFEVLMTQRDVLEAKLELVETRQKQFNAVVSVYRSLGGGWQ